MLSLNKVMLTGRLTRDPETRYLSSGTAVTNIAIAVNRRFLDNKTNEWRDETSFFDVETWGKTAERCAETLKKGRPVYVEGRLKQDTWERDGQKQSRIRISADRVTGFDVPARGGESGDMTAEDSDSEAYSSHATPAPDAPARGQRQTGAPSDALDFGGGSPSVKDDIPF